MKRWSTGWCLRFARLRVSHEDIDQAGNIVAGNRGKNVQFDSGVLQEANHGLIFCIALLILRPDLRRRQSHWRPAVLGAYLGIRSVPEQQLDYRRLSGTACHVQGRSSRGVNEIDVEALGH